MTCINEGGKNKEKKENRLWKLIIYSKGKGTRLNHVDDHDFETWRLCKR